MEPQLDFDSPQDPGKSRQARFVRFMARIGIAKCVALITLASVLGSVAVTLFYFGLFTEGLHLVSPTSWGITVVTPLLIAPLVSAHMVHLLVELDKARQMAYNLELALVMVDADRFKSVNDNYGHDVGDLVLKSLAAAAKTCLREHDVLARYGGEEFVMLLPLTDLKGAVTVAERVRATGERQDVIYDDGQVLHVTVSLGVASLTEPSATRTQLLKNADQALYQAKEQGRNQVQISPSGIAYSAQT